MNIIQVDEYIYDTSESEEGKLREYTIEGNWEEVEKLYKLDPKLCTVNINKSRGTALHVAVNDNKGEVVRNLVDSIIGHGYKRALERRNEKGDTPLHLAASRGFKDICECIIGENGERKHLILIDNNDRETPLFLAALSWQKKTFVYLFNLYDNYSYYKELIRNNGDSILHCAIRSEFFDLALIVIDKIPDLIGILNRDGFSPLKLLATRPSAFESGCKMIWWKRILYHCIPVGTLNVKHAVEYYTLGQDESSSPNNCPENYDSCYLFFLKCKKMLKGVLMERTTCTAEYGSKDMGEKLKLLPENYATCFLFMKLAWIYIFGLSGVEEITKIKQKHKWSGQLLKILMENPYVSYLGTGVKPKSYQGVNNSEEPKISTTLESETTILTKAINNLVKKVDELTTKIVNNREEPKITENRQINLQNILENETAILTAARNGIVEIVNELITKIPSSIYDVNLENKNVLLVAVENRRTNIVEALRKRFKECKTEVIFDNLIQSRDIEENTVLHLAATMSDRDWHISGSSMKMMWHIKWFEYTKELVPEHFIYRTNKKDERAEELFKKSSAKLVEEGSTWFKDISNSCSVVAVLLAGVAFATSSNVPGGNKSDTGEPILKGNPAFDTFSMSSLIGLCFSITALIMFLSILTTQKEAKDFRIDLPRKLLLGMSSLFLSMVALFVAFCSSHFFLVDHKFKDIVFLIYAVTCVPLTSYAVSQLPLYIDLLRGIATKVPMTSDKDK